MLLCVYKQLRYFSSKIILYLAASTKYRHVVSCKLLFVRQILWLTSSLKFCWNTRHNRLDINSNFECSLLIAWKRPFQRKKKSNTKKEWQSHHYGERRSHSSRTSKETGRITSLPTKETAKAKKQFRLQVVWLYFDKLYSLNKESPDTMMPSQMC